MTKWNKIETIEEFLTRGGEIKRYPMVRPEEKTETIKSSTHAGQNLMSLDEGAHFFSEIKEKKIKTKSIEELHIDMSLIPEALKKKLGLA
jgi:hypothetical protein